MTESQAGAPVNVICIKWGTLYDAGYVNNLYHGVKRHLKRPHRFVCFTDDATGFEPGIETFPLPELDLPKGNQDKRWRKLGLFRKDLADLKGPTLFLDLDIVIIDDLEPFFDYPGKFLILRNDDLFRFKPFRLLNPQNERRARREGNSSVFRMQAGEHSYIVENYIADPKGAMEKYDISQEFQSEQLYAHGELSYWPKEWCVSFKNACVPRYIMSYLKDPKPPKGTRIVVFAGNPKMSEVLDGHGGKWYRRIGNIDWLRKAWKGQ